MDHDSQFVITIAAVIGIILWLVRDGLDRLADEISRLRQEFSDNRSLIHENSRDIARNTAELEACARGKIDRK